MLSEGLLEACSILFGDQARAKLEEYGREYEGFGSDRLPASARNYVDGLSTESHADNRAHSESLEWRTT